MFLPHSLPLSPLPSVLMESRGVKRETDGLRDAEKEEEEVEEGWGPWEMRGGG